MKKHFEAIYKLVTEELEEYPFYEEWDISHEYENIWNLEVQNAPAIVVFKCEDINDNDVRLSVKLTEDIFQVVETSNWNIKYFWMALLKR